MSVSERIISAKRDGKKRVVGLLVFLPEEILDQLDDLSVFYGSIDLAVLEAIRLLHSKIYSSDFELTLKTQIDIDSIVERLESKLSQLLSTIPNNLHVGTTQNKNIDLDLPDLKESSEESSEVEDLDLDDVIEDIMVVAVDEEFNGEENNESSNTRRKRNDTKNNTQ